MYGKAGGCRTGSRHGISKILGDAAYDNIDLWEEYLGRGMGVCINPNSPLLMKYSDGRLRSNDCPEKAVAIRG